MKQMMWVVLILTALASPSWADATGCTDQPGQLLTCWLNESYDFDNFSPEPVVTVYNHYNDWALGYVAIYEPPTLYPGEISDYVVFNVDSASLYSADVNLGFPSSLNLTGLTLLGTYYESPPEPCWDCVLTFTVLNNSGQYRDTFNVVSDPSSVPEPAAIVLFGSVLLGLGLLKRSLA